jgi:hypothetical protein
MTASSNDRLDALADLGVKEVQCLLQALSQLKMRQRHFVESHYNLQATNFGVTHQFLQNVRWVQENEQQLSLTAQGEAASRSIPDLAALRTKLVESMISPNSPYRGVLVKYFLQFKPSNGEFCHHPLLADRLRESGTRNFLMDLGVVTYRATDDIYVLEQHGLELYIWATVESSSSPRRFRAESQSRTELGLRAELAIVEYEKSRLGTEWASKVEHISASKPFACYDIKSVSVQDGKVLDRFIEVKAEPADMHRFYWSASEVEAARVLRASYFLYLLPTLGTTGFDFGRLLIIQDPITSVYDNREDWEIEENVIICTQKQ